MPGISSRKKGGNLNSFVGSIFGDGGSAAPEPFNNSSTVGSPITGGAKKGRKPAAKKRLARMPRRKIIKIPTVTRGGYNIAPFLSSLILLGLRIANGDTLKKSRRLKGGGEACGLQKGGTGPSLEHFLNGIKFEGGGSILGTSSQPFEFGGTANTDNSKIKYAELKSLHSSTIGGKRGRKRRSVSPKRRSASPKKRGRKPGRKSRGGEGEISGTLSEVPAEQQGTATGDGKNGMNMDTNASVSGQGQGQGQDGGKRRGRKPKRRSVSPAKRSKSPKRRTRRGGETPPVQPVEFEMPGGAKKRSGRKPAVRRSRSPVRRSVVRRKRT